MTEAASLTAEKALDVEARLKLIEQQEMNQGISQEQIKIDFLANRDFLWSQAERLVAHIEAGQAEVLEDLKGETCQIQWKPART